MGKTDFIMDSGCIVYNTLWITTSLRDISKVELTSKRKRTQWNWIRYSF